MIQQQCTITVSKFA